jgi:ApaG protein
MLASDARALDGARHRPHAALSLRATSGRRRVRPPGARSLPMKPGHSDTTTQGIRIRVGAEYQADQSDPDHRRYAYAYRVVIENVGERPAKLVSRHWVIRDARGETREVRGPGVVGQQPELAPGARFEYTSGCPLPTEWGTMEGSYLMQRSDGELFDACIGRFFLAPNVAPISALDGR